MLLILLEWMSMSAPGLHIRTNESWSGQVVKVWPLIVVKSEGQSRKWRSWPPHWSWVPNKFATSTFDESLFPREGLRTTKAHCSQTKNFFKDFQVHFTEIRHFKNSWFYELIFFKWFLANFSTDCELIFSANFLQIFQLILTQNF